MARRCTTPARSRVWKHVDRRTPTECWPWTGWLSERGQALIAPGPGEMWVPAPHVILEEKLGRPLRPGYEACHTCDDPPCCNPDHLWEGTHAENMADMRAKGRSNRHERHGNTKLTAEDVVRIRADPRSHAKVAAEFGVSASHVGAIRQRRFWK